MRGFISIDYHEGDPSTYAGVRLSLKPDGPWFMFNTGDPTVDYLTAAIVVKYVYGTDSGWTCSSTVGHFVMDGGVLNDAYPTAAQFDTALKLAEERWHHQIKLDYGETP